VEDEDREREKHVESIKDSSILLERVDEEAGLSQKYRDMRPKKPHAPSSTKAEPAKSRRRTPTIEEIEDVDASQHQRGLHRSLPVLMGPEDTLNEMDKTSFMNYRSKPIVVEEGKTPSTEDLNDGKEFVQEFSRARYPREQLNALRQRTSKYTRNSNPKKTPRKIVKPKKLGFEEALKAVTEKHVEQIKALGEQQLTEEDIPRLRKQWVDNCQDIMNGVPNELPPVRGVNHHIPLIDDNKRYNYHLPRCPDALKPQLLEKIARYTRAGWWESVQTDQAAPILCIPKKNMTLRTALDGRKRNDNTVKDVTPFPDQDQIRLEVAGATVRSKIDFSDAYEQIRIEPEDVWKSAFATIYGTYVSHTMQIGDCNAPATFQRVMTMLFRDYI
jgi:hypothetical protein